MTDTIDRDAARRVLLYLDDPTLIKLWRTRLGITLKTMSSDCGISISYLSDIEQGRTNPSLPTFRRIVDYINSREVSDGQN